MLVSGERLAPAPPGRHPRLLLGIDAELLADVSESAWVREAEISHHGAQFVKPCIGEENSEGGVGPCRPRINPRFTSSLATGGSFGLPASGPPPRP